MTLCRELGGGVLTNDAQTFFLEKCLNDEVNMAFHPLLCLISTYHALVFRTFFSSFFCASFFFS